MTGMTIKRKANVLVVLSWLHTMLILLGLLFVIKGLTTEVPLDIGKSLLYGMILIFPVVLTYICVRKLRNMWLFLISCAAVTVLVDVLAKDRVLTALTLFVCVLRFYVKAEQGQIKRRLQEMPDSGGKIPEKGFYEVVTPFDHVSPVYFAVFVILYICVLVMKRDYLLRTIFWLLFLDALVCLIYSYLDKMLGFIRDNQWIANFPIHTMKKIAGGILGFGVLGLVVLMAPAVIYNKEPLSKIDYGQMEGTEADYEFMYSEGGGNEGMFEYFASLGKARVLPKWVRNLMDIVLYVIAGAVVLLMFMAVLKFVRHTISDFGEEEEDEIIFLHEEKKEERLRVRRERREQKYFSPEQKIRRAYKKVLKKSLESVPGGFETPLELELSAKLYENNRQMEKAHRLYEKARYSPYGCGREEAIDFVGFLQGKGE